MASVIEKIKSAAIQNNWSLALAESCTGGLISSKITAVSGVSEFYKGAVISYANDVKEDLLGVPAATLKSVGAVSPEVAISMASGVKKQMNSDWALAVTGIAGPSGGTSEKPVGTVWFAVSGPENEWTEKQVFQGSRQQIQESAAEHALRILVKAMGARG